MNAMEFIDLPSDVHNLIRNLVPLLLFTSKQFGGRLLNAGDKMDLLLEMGYSVAFEKNTIIWCLYGKKIYVDELGHRCWYNEGQRHRTKGPAVVKTNGTKYWYSFGVFHRTNGPAVEHFDGYKEWRLNGQLHREGGPAVEYPNDLKEWWVDGRFHGDMESVD